jgi:hypothetical protein
MDDAMTNDFDDLVQTSSLAIVSCISFSPLNLLHHLLEHHPSELEYFLWEPMARIFFSFAALSFRNLFSCHFGKLIEHISFISVLNSGKSFLILGTPTFCSDLAPRISIDDFPTSLPSIAEFFSNVIGFSIVKFRYELFSFRPSYFTR